MISGRETACTGRMLALCLLAMAVLAFPLISFASDEDGRYESLTVERLLGVGLDVEAPPSGLTLPDRGLVLGLAANLDLLGGSLDVSEVPTNLVRNLNVRGGSAGPSGADSGRFYAYVITAFVDGNEYLQRYDYLRLEEGSGSWGITFEWQADSRLCDLTRIGARTGYRIYREVVPGNTSGVISDPNSQSLERIAEIPLGTNSADIRVVDDGVAAIGGYPTYSASGSLEVSNLASVGSLQVAGNARVQSDLFVASNLRVSGNLGVGTSAPSGGPGTVRINRSLSVGTVNPPSGVGDACVSGRAGIGASPVPDARLNVVDTERANIYLDATAGPAALNFGGQVWELASTGFGSFVINDLLVEAGGECCANQTPAAPRFVIDSRGGVGIGLTPGAGAGAGSLSVAQSLGVGTAAPNVCGGINTCGPVNVGGALNANAGLNVGGDLQVARNAQILGDTDIAGDLKVYGTKFFVQRHPEDPAKVITYASLEGPEAGTYVRGTAQLTGGEAVIELPESFHLVTADSGVTAQVTVLEDCNGLYVADKSAERIVVRELTGGTSDARFDYLVQGVRQGYEDLQVMRDAGGE